MFYYPVLFIIYFGGVTHPPPHPQINFPNTGYCPFEKGRGSRAKESTPNDYKVLFLVFSDMFFLSKKKELQLYSIS